MYSDWFATDSLLVFADRFAVSTVAWFGRMSVVGRTFFPSVLDLRPQRAKTAWSGTVHVRLRQVNYAVDLCGLCSCVTMQLDGYVD